MRQFIRGCTGKAFYASFKAAETGARNLRRHMHETVRAYKCHACEGFHVGHANDDAERPKRKQALQFRAMEDEL